ncbi:hypothetical protein AC1031_010149 [Aphanomyces cochlioides]|nr:hypothetical protein AC1031_010149 [Aphanomyces cochlioides]
MAPSFRFLALSMEDSARSLNPVDTRLSPTRATSTTEAIHYRLVAQIILKETEAGRDNKGHLFDLQVFEGSSVSSIKTKLWSFIHGYLQPIALYTGLPKVWSIQTTQPSMADFDKYVSFKLNKQIITTGERLKHRLLKHKNETFTVLVYKWGVNIRSTTDLIEFK